MSATELEIVEEKNKRNLFSLAFFSEDKNKQLQIIEEDIDLETDNEEEEKPFSEQIRFPVQLDKKTLQVAFNGKDLPEDLAFINEPIAPEQKMKELQVLFSQINHDIAKVVTAMGTANSVINRMAKKWGELPLVAKITIGIVSGIALIGVGTAGVFAHILILPTLAGVTGVAAITTTALLDDHYEANQTLLNEIKQGFISLASILQVTIYALEKIRAEFEVELGKLKHENAVFKSNNEELMTQVNRLRVSVNELEMNRSIMQQSISKLECQIDSLEKGSVEQKKVSETLRLLKDKQQSINDELKQELMQLEQTNQEIRESKQQAQEAVAAITTAFEALASGQIKNTEERKHFMRDLLTIVNKRDEKLISTIAGFEQTEQKLEETTSELASLKRSYETLNQTYADLLGQHQQILNQHRLLIAQQQDAVVEPFAILSSRWHKTRAQ